jgi:hypothetical protein
MASTSPPPNLEKLFTGLWECDAMKPRGQVLGPARARFNDYVGTVAADDAEVVKDQPSLYELADVDRDRYTILAVDLSIDGAVTATVYAIDRVEHGIRRHGEIAELSTGERQIPVVAFDIAELNVEDLIRHAFRRISIRLVTRHLRDLVLVVTEPS